MKKERKVIDPASLIQAFALKITVIKVRKGRWTDSAA